MPRPWPSLFLLLEAAALALLLPRTRPSAPPSPALETPRKGVRVLAVGDLMTHHDVKLAAEHSGGFAPLWEGLRPLLAQADLCIVNLETPIAPNTGAPGAPYRFNAPAALAQALAASGFQVAVTANNHAVDQGARGVLETLGHLKAAGVDAVGTGRSPEEAEAGLLLEREGLRLALLACTDVHYPGFRGSPGRPSVSVLDLDAVAARIRARAAEADAVLVSVHWGFEEQHAPSPRQWAVAQALVAAGADLVLGHHPHVLQPLAWVEAGGRKGLVAFSLGNFISNQNRHYRDETDPVAQGDARDGAALCVEIVRRPQGGRGVHLLHPRVVPLWTTNNWRTWSLGREARREIRVVSAGASGEASGLLERRRNRALEILGRAVPVE